MRTLLIALAIAAVFYVVLVLAPILVGRRSLSRESRYCCSTWDCFSRT
jgi:hypothetical protein